MELRSRENHLAGEKSLYLRQHAHNPVDWHPWSEEAFTKAKAEDKPIFLSIGYSACHWCHVMAHESFQDDGVAEVLNRSFVSIKVDREERPDLDSIYMLACQMISGGGGWPLTIITTPDGRPFFAGTYFRKGGGPEGPGLIDILMHLDEKWRSDRSDILKSAEEIAAALQEFSSYHEPGIPDPDIGSKAFQAFSQAFDERYGGFETAPKFPAPHRLNFLLRYWSDTAQEGAMRMVTSTLDAMRSGGINDQVGYGFHRYSTDQRWLLPHFEKMLYDQALQVLAFTEAYAATGEERYRRTASNVLAFVEREMSSPFGGFYSAIGADSQGEEGDYYVWKYDEVGSLIPPTDLALFVEAYDVQKEGNFRDEASRKRTGKNVLHLARPPSLLAQELGLDEGDVAAMLERGLARLFEAREGRARPDVDDKVLADWNGLMIAAFAHCARVFGDEDLARKARRGADFVLSQMSYGEGRLFHRHVDGQAAVPGFLDDYAFMAWGLTELYLATFSTRYLRSAVKLTEALIDHFWDRGQGGFYFTADDSERILARSKQVYDGAMPSGNSISACLLERLGRMTGDPRYRELAQELVRAFASDLNANPMAHAQMLQAWRSLQARSRTVVVLGDLKNEETRTLLMALQEGYDPDLLVILSDTPEAAELTGTTGLERLEDAATAYIIRGEVTSPPFTDIKALGSWSSTRGK